MIYLVDWCITSKKYLINGLECTNTIAFRIHKLACTMLDYDCLERVVRHVYIDCAHISSSLRQCMGLAAQVGRLLDWERSEKGREKLKAMILAMPDLAWDIFEFQRCVKDQKHAP